jgi:DNA-binding transcriptional LysR family regulator
VGSAGCGPAESSLSCGVDAVERDLGVRLFQRTTRQVTDAGHAYFESVSRALSGVDEAAAAVSQLQDAPRRLVRVTAPPDLGLWMLAPSASRFASRYPEVQLEFSLTQRVVDLVQEGFDLALRAGKLADTGPVARPLGSIRAGLFASPEYLKRMGRPRSVAQLAEHDCVLFRATFGKALWELVGPSGQREDRGRSSESADDNQFVRAAPAAGQGIALLPLLACSGPFNCRELTRVLPDHATAGVSVSLVYPNARFLRKRVALLRDQLLKELFFILEGTCEVTVGDHTSSAGPGTIVFIPRGVVHRFKNVGDATARMLDWSLPGGQDHYFRAISDLTAGNGFSGEKVMEINKQFDTKFLDPH